MDRTFPNLAVRGPGPPLPDLRPNFGPPDPNQIIVVERSLRQIRKDERLQKVEERKSTSPIRQRVEGIRAGGFQPSTDMITPCSKPSNEKIPGQPKITLAEYLLQLISIEPYYLLTSLILKMDDLYQIFNWPGSYGNLARITEIDRALLSDQFSERVYQFRDARAVKRLALALLATPTGYKYQIYDKEEEYKDVIFKPKVEIDKGCLISGLSDLELSDFFWSGKLVGELAKGFHFANARTNSAGVNRRAVVEIFAVRNKIASGDLSYLRNPLFWKFSSLPSNQIGQLAGQPGLFKDYHQKGSPLANATFTADAVDYTNSNEAYVNGQYLESFLIVETAKRLSPPIVLRGPQNKPILQPIYLKTFFLLPTQSQGIILANLGVPASANLEDLDLWRRIVVESDRVYLTSLPFLKLLLRMQAADQKVTTYLSSYGAIPYGRSIKRVFRLWYRGFFEFSLEEILKSLEEEPGKYAPNYDRNLFQARLKPGPNPINIEIATDYPRYNLGWDPQHYFNINTGDLDGSTWDIPHKMDQEEFLSLIAGKERYNQITVWNYYIRDIPSQDALDDLRKEINEVDLSGVTLETLQRKFYSTKPHFAFYKEMRAFLYRNYPQIISLERIWQLEKTWQNRKDNSKRDIDKLLIDRQIHFFWFALLNILATGRRAFSLKWTTLDPKMKRDFITVEMNKPVEPIIDIRPTIPSGELSRAKNINEKYWFYDWMERLMSGHYQTVHDIEDDAIKPNIFKDRSYENVDWAQLISRFGQSTGFSPYFLSFIFLQPNLFLYDLVQFLVEDHPERVGALRMTDLLIFLTNQTFPWGYRRIMDNYENYVVPATRIIELDRYGFFGRNENRREEENYEEMAGILTENSISVMAQKLGLVISPYAIPFFYLWMAVWAKPIFGTLQIKETGHYERTKESLNNYIPIYFYSMELAVTAIMARVTDSSADGLIVAYDPDSFSLLIQYYERKIYSLDELVQSFTQLSRVNILQISQRKDLLVLISASPSIQLWARKNSLFALEDLIYQVWAQIWATRNEWITPVQTISLSFFDPILAEYEQFYQKVTRPDLSPGAVGIMKEARNLNKRASNVINEFFQRNGIQQYPILDISSSETYLEMDNNFIKMYNPNWEEDDVDEDIGHFLTSILALKQIRYRIWRLEDSPPSYQMPLIFPTLVTTFISYIPVTN